MNHLPDSLQAQLKAARRRLGLVETSVAALGGLCGLLFTYLLLFVSDRFWETPVWLRFASAAAGLLCAALGAWWWVTRYTRRRDPRRLALLVQSRFRRFGDRLLSVVELSDPAKLPDHVSKQLVEAATAQVAGEAAAFDFREAVPTRSLRRWIPTFVLLAGLGAAALILTPSAGRNALLRWLRPAARVERYTFTRLAELDAQRIVPYGEPFGVEARLRDDSAWLPASGRARVERQAPLTAAERARTYAFEVPGQTRDGTLAVAVGDARATLSIRPVFRPDLVALSAEIRLPDYLGHPPQATDILKGTLEMVEGSRVVFTGLASRALASAELRAPEGAKAAALQDRRFVTPSLAMAAPTGRVAFAWKDRLGLEGRQAFALDIRVRPDGAPSVDCPGLRRTTAILEDEALAVPIRAEDDSGVKQLGLQWDYAESAEGPVTRREVLTAAAGGVMDAVLETSARFAPAALGLGPGRVELAATAADFRPGRPPSTSAVFTVFILDKAEHARLLHRELERLQARLEDIVRAEEQQLDETRRLAEAKETDARRGTDQIRETARAEAENRAQLRRLREDFEKLAREALRNASIDEEQIGRMAKTTQQAGAVEQQEMQRAEQALEQAAQADRDAGEEQQKRAQELAEAQKEQAQALAKLREALERLGKAGEDLLADSFVNRLKSLARAEREIFASVTGALARTIGQRFEDLPADLRTLVEVQAANQRQVQKRTKDLSTDMEYFLKRVAVAEVRAVRAELEETNAVARLGDVAAVLLANKLVQGQAETAEWARQFQAWADKLKKRRPGGGEGQPPTPKEMAPEMVDLILRLFRVRQWEEDLRESTRALDDRRLEDARYPERARLLAARQAEIREAFLAAPQAAGVPAEALADLQELFGAVEGSMDESEAALMTLETGGPAVGPQTVVIELLSPQEQETEPQSGKPRKSGMMSSQMMAMMRRMQQQLGLQSGRKPGPMGSLAGGTTDGESPPGGGTAAAGRGARDIDKAGGRATASWPAEYRDAIEGYFNAVESSSP